MNGKIIKDDFENIFLANEGQTFSIIRNGIVAGTEKGILNGNLIQMRAEADIRVDDILRSNVSGASYKVKQTTFETVDDVRTCREIHFSKS